MGEKGEGTAGPFPHILVRAEDILDVRFQLLGARAALAYPVCT